MTRRRLILLAAAGSAALLTGAFLFQAMGYLPCRICIWQRWPHAVAILAGVGAFVFAPRLFALVGAGAALVTAGIGIFHTGVERGWWDGPQSCTGEGLGGLSGADLLSFDAPAPPMCDEVAWALFGISMASWNAILSLLLAGLWIAAVRRGRETV